MIWAMRTEKLTGDTAGYGQVVPLVRPFDSALIMMWHAACGALAAPFSPVFLGQGTVPREYGPHRYLTAGESHRFLDNRKAVNGGVDTVSLVAQINETTVGAFQDSKRLIYLMQFLGKATLAPVHDTFSRHEARVAALTRANLRVAETAMRAGNSEDAIAVLSAFFDSELTAALSLVRNLVMGLSVQATAMSPTDWPDMPKGFPQLW